MQDIRINVQRGGIININNHIDALPEVPPPPMQNAVNPNVDQQGGGDHNQAADAHAMGDNLGIQEPVIPQPGGDNIHGGEHQNVPDRAGEGLPRQNKHVQEFDDDGFVVLKKHKCSVEIFDSGVGIYAPDAESYTLFNPIIEGFKPGDKHPATDFGNINTLVDVDPTGKFVVSTRVRCGRSLQGYAFNPCLTEVNYKEMEDKIMSIFGTFEGELKGKYHPLTGMDKATQQQLIDDHFLFKDGDRFMQTANACRYWPTGRGIYQNDAKTFLVWVNEEDHMRIISMQKGGDLKAVFKRLVSAVNIIEQKLPFSRDDRLGYLTFCPTNLGTTIRASVHIALPKLAKDKKVLDDIAAKFNLQVRGTRGEHTESEGGVYDISNKRRMDVTEYQAVKEMQNGILEMIKMEEAAP